MYVCGISNHGKRHLNDSWRSHPTIKHLGLQYLIDPQMASECPRCSKSKVSRSLTYWTNPASNINITIILSAHCQLTSTCLLLIRLKVALYKLISVCRAIYALVFSTGGEEIHTVWRLGHRGSRFGEIQNLEGQTALGDEGFLAKALLKTI